MTTEHIHVCWAISGGRDVPDDGRLYRALDEVVARLGMPDKVVHGGQRGADLIGARYFFEKGVKVVPCDAYWSGVGNGAGPVRNQALLDAYRPDLVVAFPTGGPGTADMIKRSREAGVRLEIVDMSPPGPEEEDAFA